MLLLARLHLGTTKTSWMNQRTTQRLVFLHLHAGCLLLVAGEASQTRDWTRSRNWPCIKEGAHLTRHYRHQAKCAIASITRNERPDSGVSLSRPPLIRRGAVQQWGLNSQRRRLIGEAAAFLLQRFAVVEGSLDESRNFPITYLVGVLGFVMLVQVLGH